MLKLFALIKAKIGQTEARLTHVINTCSTDSESISGLFYFQKVWLNLKLIVLELSADIIKFIIILGADSGKGFSILFDQKELHTCKHSYRQYKVVQQKLRVFSFSGFSSVVAATVIVSLVMNLFMAPYLPAQAATFGWTQSSWTGTTSATARATLTDQNWTQYESKGAILAADNLTLSQVPGPVVGVIHTDVASMVAGTTTGMTVIGDKGDQESYLAMCDIDHSVASTSQDWTPTDGDAWDLSTTTPGTTTTYAQDGIIEVAGTHCGIANFNIPNGLVVKVKTWSGTKYGSFKVTADNINIDGTIDGNGSGGTFSNAVAGVYDNAWDSVWGMAHGGGGLAMPAYDSIKTPSMFGSHVTSGYYGNAVASSSNGGGVVHLTGVNQITINGTVKVNGIFSNVTNNRTAGSAGSIYVNAPILNGSGSLLATSSWASSGGRIAVYYGTNNFTGGMDTSSGFGYMRQDLITVGSAGTLYLKDSHKQLGDLVVDNHNMQNIQYPNPVGIIAIYKNQASDVSNGYLVEGYDNVSLINDANFTANNLTVNNLVVNSGSSLTINDPGILNIANNNADTLTYTGSDSIHNPSAIIVPTIGGSAINKNIVLNNIRLYSPILRAKSLTLNGTSLLYGRNYFSTYPYSTTSLDVNLSGDLFVSASSSIVADVASTLGFNGYPATTSLNEICSYNGALTNCLQGSNSSGPIIAGRVPAPIFNSTSNATATDALGNQFSLYWTPASHGGLASSTFGHNVGPTYDNFRQPTLPGMWTGFYNGYYNFTDIVPGGGVIKINVANNTTVNGKISASAYPLNDDFQAFAGTAGGSVWLKTYKLDGTGQFVANGGGVSYDRYETSWCRDIINPDCNIAVRHDHDTQDYGGGGGGRIAIEYDDPESNWLGTTSVKSGFSNAHPDLSGIGSVYIRNAASAILYDAANPGGVPVSISGYINKTLVDGEQKINSVIDNIKASLDKLLSLANKSMQFSLGVPAAYAAAGDKEFVSTSIVTGYDNAGGTPNYQSIVIKDIKAKVAINGSTVGVASSAVKFQFATSSDNVTWSTFAGPTGTASYYNASNATSTVSASSASGPFMNAKYVRYKAVVEATAAYTPSVEIQEVAVNWFTGQFNTQPQALVSSWYNTGGGAMLGKVSWYESTSTPFAEVWMQLQTASSTAGVPTSPSGWVGPNGSSTSYFDSTNIRDGNGASVGYCGSTGDQPCCSRNDQTGYVECSVPRNMSITDDKGDIFVQYKVTLSSGTGYVTPTVDNIGFKYAINLSPSIAKAANTPNSAQLSNNTISTWFNVTDPDTFYEEGGQPTASTPGFVKISAQYNDGSKFVDLPNNCFKLYQTDADYSPSDSDIGTTSVPLVRAGANPSGGFFSS